MSWFDFVVSRAENIGPWKSVSFRTIREAAEKEGIFAAEAELYCLDHGYVPSRYIRSMGTIGLDGQAKLLRSSVAVIGCGGLGGLTVELLARAGIGRLVLVDGDVFDETNLNRQVLSTEENLGASKAMTAAKRVVQINGAVDAEGRQCRFDSFTAEGILQGVDVAVDCLDSFSSRQMLFPECASRGIPVVSGAIAGFWGQVRVLLPGEDALRHYLAGDSDAGMEMEAGNPPFTPAVVAALECAQVINLITDKGELLSDELLWIDLAENEFSKLCLK